MSEIALPTRPADEASTPADFVYETRGYRTSSSDGLVYESSSSDEVDDPKPYIDKGKGKETDIASEPLEIPVQPPSDQPDGQNNVPQATDPVFLQKTLGNLRPILSETVQVLSSLPAQSHTISTKVSCDVCQKLMNHANDLTEIVSGYAMMSSGSAGKLPLDSTLYEWLTAVRVEAMNLREEAFGWAANLQPPEHPPMNVIMMGKVLDDRRREMENLLSTVEA